YIGRNNILLLIPPQYILRYVYRPVSRSFPDIIVETNDDHTIRNVHISAKTSNNGLNFWDLEVWIIIFDITKCFCKLSLKIRQIAKCGLGFLVQGIYMGIIYKVV